MREMDAAWIMNFHQFLLFESFRKMRPSSGLIRMLAWRPRLMPREYQRRSSLAFNRAASKGCPMDPNEDLPTPGKFPTIFNRWMQIVQRARGTLWTPEALVSVWVPTNHPEYARYVQSVVALWDAYEMELQKRNLIDFNDMISMAVRGLMENERLRRFYGDKFQHILVDEFQDTSEAQNELLRSLAGDDFSRVTVVGDDKQSIYRWRDARVQNLREFVGTQEETRQNYRSRQTILDLAHHFVIRDDYFKEHAAEIRLDASRGATDAPVCLFHPEDSEDKSFEEEAKGLAAWILALTGRLDPGESPFTYYGVRGGDEALQFDEIAVLMRSLKPSLGSPALRKSL